jgi:hypothetical protein
MTFSRHFIVNEQSFGTGQDHWRRVHGEVQDPSPYALFCPGCVRIWAKMPVEGSNRNWMVFTVPCEEHPEAELPYKLAGSVLFDWDSEILRLLPPEMVKREFELHMRYWEQKNG